jgi:DNA end-binding protein Ku
MARPFWSGHIQISLVSFGVELFPATEAKGEIHFHQLSRKTGERVRHRNVSTENKAVEKDDIVKGYEYARGEYVTIEPEDLANLRIPSRSTVEIAQFVSLDEIGPMFYEKPYFVTPQGSNQLEAFAVVRKSLQQTSKVGLGKIAFGGREHLLALAAPSDESELGMMAYVLRYAQELRSPAEHFSNIQPVKIDSDQLALAEELIKRKTSRFDPSRFKDEYEEALRAMVDAKLHRVPQKKRAAAPHSAKVINLMDALRKSVGSDDGRPGKKPPARVSASSAKVTSIKQAGRKASARKKSA